VRHYIFSLFILLFTIFPISTCFAENINLNCSSAILIDAKSGNILYEHNAYEKSYPASTTKVLTALIALSQETDYSKEVIPSHYAVYSVPAGSSIAYFSEDEKLTFEQVLYGLMLPSGNDAANILAEHISGSIENFADLMNKKAIELGAKNTHFINPNGLHDENHYTTAYDLSLFAKEAMKIEKFREIVSTYHYVMPSTNRSNEDRDFYNTNKLITPNGEYFYEYATGIKTGYTSVAKNCLISSAEKNGVELICVVLGGLNTSNNKSAVYTDTINLLNYGFDQYKSCNILNKETVINNLSIKHAKDKIPLTVVNESAIDTVILKDTTPVFEEAISYDYELIAPIKKGDIVGTISYYQDDSCVGSSNLIADNDIEKESMLLYWFRTICKILLYIILSIILLGILLRLFNEIRKKIKRSKRHYKNHPRI